MHPAIVGYKVKVFTNGGWRNGQVVKVTQKRVRIQWPKATRPGEFIGAWFRNENGSIGVNCQYGTDAWGPVLEDIDSKMEDAINALEEENATGWSEQTQYRRCQEKNEPQ